MSAETWRETTVMIACRGLGHDPEMEEVAGFACEAIPGLVVSESTDWAEQWRLTHEASGYAIPTGWFDTLDEAKAALLRVGPLFDWTRPAPELVADKAVHGKIFDALRSVSAPVPQTQEGRNG